MDNTIIMTTLVLSAVNLSAIAALSFYIFKHLKEHVMIGTVSSLNTEEMLEEKFKYEDYPESMNFIKTM